MIGSNYIVRILPNNMILVMNQENKESKVLKPRELGTFFEKELEAQIKVWDEHDNNYNKIKSEMDKA